MKRFFLTLPRNLVGCFKGWKLVWHLVAILLTFILVMSGFDWRYFLATRSPELRSWMFPAVIIGGLLPFYLPLALLAAGYITRNARTILTGWAVAEAELLGALIVIAYKAFTGRAHPMHSVGQDISHVFHFGFLRGGVFWGWPSSHTTIAFAMAVTVFTLYPKQRWVGLVAILYAFYVGIGVSMTIHWFSDFVAGAIIGSAIGTVVGKSYSGKTPNIEHPTLNIQ
ncbi:MAG TPA: phosphatase PAP2 family protein [Candidatus Limnocylindrales bacterium]|nr:phosphatase PAP2 family protein [Candidatus Limnocylindrales bacterium]